MAEVVLGLGSSHTPQLSTSADYWAEHAARDQRNPRLLGADGRYHSYDDLLAAAARPRSRRWPGGWPRPHPTSW